jgi:hypothetical protein
MARRPPRRAVPTCAPGMDRAVMTDRLRGPGGVPGSGGGALAARQPVSRSGVGRSTPAAIRLATSARTSR